MVELTWQGKYDAEGHRTAPVRIALPFQTVETVNESGQVRAHNLDLWSQGQPTEWRNRLIWGDKKYVLPALLRDFAGKINLIYIDPPFATGADFSFTTTIPETDESFTKAPSMIELKAYRDTWGNRPDSYLQWFYETVVLLHELLAEDGSIYVHCDWRLNSALRLVMDEVFGADNFRNEIAWAYRSGGASRKESLPRKHDSIFLYAKSPLFVVHAQTERQYLDKPFMGSKIDKDGRNYVDTLLRDVVEGEVVIVQSEDTLIRYNARPVLNLSNERLDYPTQKPIGLLKLLLQIGSSEGDIVLDCFCGSGTTAAAADETGRRWITCDLGRFAIHTARKRLLSIPNVKPFMVQNLGKYERQAWQAAEFAQGDATQSAAAQLAYRRFMLALYRAQPLEGHAWLHGLRDGRLVHIGGVDAPVSLGDVKAITGEVWKVRGQDGATNAVDILGWDFAFELNEVGKQMAAEANVALRFKRIPREVLEKRAVEQGDIRFFELAALSVTVSQRARETVDPKMEPEQPGGRAVTVTLSDFIVPPDEVPDEIAQAVRDWSQWVDYWAVDWDYKGDAFHNMAQTYRTRKDPNHLQKSLAHLYDAPGTYTIVVKVIDILGNDTTKTLSITVA